MEFSKDEYVEVINYTSSSAIKSAMYHAGEKELILEFTSTGKCYRYENVDESVVREMILAEHREGLGAFFNAEIRSKFKGFPY